MFDIEITVNGERGLVYARCSDKIDGETYSATWNLRRMADGTMRERVTVCATDRYGEVRCPMMTRHNKAVWDALTQAVTNAAHFKG